MSAERKVAPLRGEVAIVGMSGMFSQAPNLETYWKNILQRVNALHPVPADRFDRALFYDPTGTRDDRIHADQGGFIDYPLYFDAASHGIMPSSVQDGEAEQFLLFQLVDDALKDAGWDKRSLPALETQIIVARGNYATSGMLGQQLRTERIEEVIQVIRALHPEHTEEELERIRQECLAGTPRHNADTAMSLIPNLLSGRVANRLDLMGSNYTLDGACASSIIAVELMVRDLLTGKCDLGIVGAAHSFTNISFLVLFSTFRALSRSGRCRPFDAEADGILPGDGLGVMLLKRLEDAERDGDKIYAVIKGVGSSSDGKALSLIAPRLEGESLAIERALTMADVPPETVELIEAHGTGTPTGDQTEITAIQRAFGQRPEGAASLAVGSVKSMIGHCMPAAGMAGMLKTALALYHKVLPPSLGCDTPNPAFHWDASSVHINSETRPWFRSNPQIPRRAGVNAFGFGGVNSHIVLEEYVPKHLSASMAEDAMPWETELCVLRGSSRPALLDAVKQLQGYLRSSPDARLTDVAWTLSLTAGANRGGEQLAIVATSTEDLAGKLDRATQRLSGNAGQELRDLNGIYWTPTPLGPTGKVAALFPGANSTSINMLRDLCLHFPFVREVFEAEDARDLRRHKQPLSQVLFPPPPLTAEDRDRTERALTPERQLQALVVANRAMHVLFERLGLKPDMIVGHSQGEWSALEAAQMVNFNPGGEAQQRLDSAWAQFVQLPPRPEVSIVAVNAARERVETVIARMTSPVYITVDNCPHQVLVAGSDEAIAALVSALRQQKISCEALPLRNASHTPLYEGFAQLVQTLFSLIPIQTSSTCVYSSMTAAPLPSDAALVKQQLVDMWTRPAQFRRCIENMYADGARIFVELGHRGTLTAFVDDTLESKPHVAVASDLTSRGGTTQLNHCLGVLSAHGVPLDLQALFSRRAKKRLDFTRSSTPAKPSTQGVRLTFGNHSLRTPSRGSVVATAAPPPPPPSLEESPEPMSSHVMKEYFQLMERFLALQREVMQAYLASGGKAEGLAPLSGLESVFPLPKVEAPPPPPAPARAINGTAKTGVSVAAASPVPAAKVNGAVGGQQLKDSLLALVSDKTGYPVDMLGLDLNLEAELGIDSIKRTEIVAAFGRQHGMNFEVPRGTVLSTLRHMMDFFSRSNAGTATHS